MVDCLLMNNLIFSLKDTRFSLVCCKKLGKSFKLYWLLFNSNTNDLKSIRYNYRVKSLN